ncbi:MAG: RluA family pseudouridine synthase [Candidatus Shapirobacteria bacterium]|jgi:23S rRNA pseudouridine1911/1915/1917 synthase
MEEKAEIVYQDEDILVLNKKTGVVCTKEDYRSKETLEDWLLEKFGDNKLPRQGIVHRLDKGTSGLMVVAKTEKMRSELVKKFKSRTIKKTYIALVEGDLPKSGEIKMPISRSKYVFGRFAVSSEGKEAETAFNLIKKYEFLGKFYSLIEIELKTGRTHQIRVHFSYLKWPLVGDFTYGGKEMLDLKRPFLQAKKLSFKQPITGKELDFECELAPDLKAVLEKL